MHTNSTHSVVSTLAVALGIVSFASPAAFAYTTEPGWVTNSYFKAAAENSAGVYVNGDWTLNAPATNAATFAIDSTQTVFSVAKNGMSDTRKVVQVDCDLTFSSYYYLDDITNDVTSAIAALSLVTNETTGAMTWMGLKGGDTWVALTGSGVTTATGGYKTRIEVDYDATTVRYLVKPTDSSSDYVTLKEGNDEWFATSATPVMSNVCFIGKTTLTSIDAKLSTTAAAEVNGTDYATINEALAAAKAKSNTIVLYKDVSLVPSELKGAAYNDTTYSFNKNSKNLTVAQSAWTVNDGSGVTVEASGNSVTVSAAKNLVASIGDTNTNTTAYFTLSEAFTAAEDGDTVIAFADFNENASLSGSKAVVLDLGGHTVSKTDVSSPVLTVSGSELSISNGWIMGSSDAAALSAAGGANVTVVDGLYNGKFVTADDSTKVTILSGYFIDSVESDTTFEGGKFSATGGKFMHSVSNAAATGNIVASGYKLAELAVPYTYAEKSITCEIMTNVVDSSTGESVATKTWSVKDDSEQQSIGGVQIPDSWANTNLTGSNNSEKQADLNTKTAYGTGAQVKKWEAYVLGIPTDSSKANQGPVVKGVQNSTSGTIGFSISDPTAIKAKESGCDVKFTVQAFSDPTLSTSAGDESAKVDYTETVEVTPSTDGVRYYKLKMYITPKK